MAESYLLNEPTDKAFDILKSRRGFYNSHKNNQYYKTSMRNNAWVSVTIDGLTLPDNNNTFKSQYGGGGLKPPPILENVDIAFFSSEGQSLTIKVNFRCFTRKDFKIMESRWMRYVRLGNVYWGYKNPYHKAEQTGNEIKGMQVSNYSFSAAEDGSYVCSVSLIAPGAFLKSADVKMGMKDAQTKSNQGLVYKTKNVFGNVSKHFVNSIEELLLFDAQQNGETVTDDIADNTRIKTQWGDILIYHPPEKGGMAGAFQRSLGKLVGRLFNSGDKQWTYHSEYFSLEYIVNRIINDQMLGFFRDNVVEKQKDIASKIKLVCNEVVTNAYGYSHVRSADPAAILLLGKNRGTYISPDGAGKDFENGGASGGSSVTCLIGGDNADISKVMFERSVIEDALESAADAVENTDVASKPGGVKATKVSIRIDTFIEKLSSRLKEATGEIYELALIEDPKDIRRMLVIVSSNGASKVTPCFVFDPIDGDGGTRSMSITSGAGSEEYRRAQFALATGASDPTVLIAQKQVEADAKRLKNYADAVHSINEYVTKTLPESAFDITSTAGLAQSLKKYKESFSSKLRKTTFFEPYAGLTLSGTIDGVWGLRAGNLVHTTLTPETPYRKQSTGICFRVSNVSHSISNGDWVTTFEASMTTANLKYI
jgi:hypothetical protein